MLVSPVCVLVIAHRCTYTLPGVRRGFTAVGQAVPWSASRRGPWRSVYGPGLSI